MVQKVMKNRARTMMRRMIPELYDSHRCLDLVEEKKQEKTIGKHMLFEKSCFLLHRPIDDQKGIKNDPKMNQKVIQNLS